MESLNTVLGIVASILSIISVILTVRNTIEVNKIKGSIISGDDSVNTIGNHNDIKNGN